MTTQTTTDLQATRQEIARRIEATTDAIADAVTALGQAASANTDGELVADLSRQVTALNDHLRNLRGELGGIVQALHNRQALDTLREALTVAARAADELQGGVDAEAGETGPAIVSAVDLAALGASLRHSHMRPMIYS